MVATQNGVGHFGRGALVLASGPLDGKNRRPKFAAGQRRIRLQQKTQHTPVVKVSINGSPKKPDDVMQLLHILLSKIMELK
ncbi:hypothetical protein BHE74_00039629 [Ensete ventricosum]|nr:hypothetical protein GW17_00049080 [Ensete ventricosum]RWW53839.1 hypothetical protein BHE74_00039629 [Ensete ventricosum]